MEVRTFTNFWNMEKKIYSIYDVSLPVPISLKVAGAFLLAGIPWWILLAILHVPILVSPLYLLWILPPIIVGYLSSRPIFQRKTMIEFLTSLTKYYLQPRRLGGLRPAVAQYGTKFRLLARIFNRDDINEEKTQEA